MNTLTSIEPVSSVSAAVGIAPLQFALRIVQSGQPERTMPLASGKCTVGSSSRCQVQLASPQVRPLHCLLVHEGEETTVTRWAAGALLNGQDFTTTTFCPGDCLQIGDVEVTLVAESVSEGVPKSAADKQTPPSPPEKLVQAETTAIEEIIDEIAEEVSEELEVVEKVVAPAKPRPVSGLASRPAMADPTMSAANALESDRLVRQLWSANYGARQRCRKLVRSLRDVRTEASNFDQQLDILQEQLRKTLAEREQVSGELNQLQSESTSREEQVAEELDRLISELSVAYEKSSEAEAASTAHVQIGDELRGELETLYAEREQLQADFERALAATEAAASQGAEQSEVNNQLQADLEKIQLQKSELEETIAEFQHYQPEWESAVSERDQRIGELLREMEQIHGTILALEESDVEQMARIEHLQSELGQAQAATVSGDQQVADHVANAARIQEELSLLRQERDQLLGSQTKHSEDQKQWEQSLAERDRRIEELQIEHKGVCETLETFEQGAFEQIDACKRLEEKLAEVCEQRDQIALVQAEREQQSQQLEETLQCRDRQIAELSEELGTLAQGRGELQSELEGQKSAAEQLESEVLKLRARCEDSSSDFDSSEQRYAEIQQAFSGQQEELEQVRQQLEAAHQQKETLESTLAERIAKCEIFESGQADLHTRCEQLAADHATESERCQELGSNLAQRQQSIMLFEADLKSVRAELQRSVDRTQQLEGKCDAAESQLAALQEELEAKDAHLIDAGEVDSTWQQERDDLVRTLEATQQELAEARECLIAAEKALLNLPASGPEEFPSSEPVAESELPANEEPVEASASDEEAEAAIARLKEMSVWSETENSPESAIESTEESEVSEEEAEKEDFTPPSFIDQFGPDFEEPNFEEENQPEEEPTCQAPVKSDESPIVGLEDESDDAALEAYMQNMMRRVRGDSVSEEVATPLVDPKDAPAEDPVAIVDSAIKRVASSTCVEVEEPLSLECLKRSSHKPDLPVDLTAMRELANSSARGAIAEHNKGRHLEAAFSKFLICLLATGLAVYILWTAENYFSVRSIGGWVAGAMGATWGFKMLGVLLEAIRAGSQQHQAAAKIVGAVTEASDSNEA